MKKVIDVAEIAAVAGAIVSAVSGRWEIVTVCMLVAIYYKMPRKTEQ